MTQRMKNQIEAFAEADGKRPVGAWIRLQLEKTLEDLSNGKAKK